MSDQIKKDGTPTPEAPADDHVDGRDPAQCEWQGGPDRSADDPG